MKESNTTQEIVKGKINIDDDFYIMVEDTCYTLKRTIYGKSRDNTKVISYPKVLGYFSSLEGALKQYSESVIQDRLQQSEWDLQEAVDEIKRVTTETHNLIDRIVKGDG